MSSKVNEARRLIALQIKEYEDKLAKLRFVGELLANYTRDETEVVETTIDEEAAIKAALSMEKPKSKHDMIKCPQCDAVYKSQGWLDRHIENEHSEASRENFALCCETCDFTTPDDAQLMIKHCAETHGRGATIGERTRRAIK